MITGRALNGKAECWDALIKFVGLDDYPGYTRVPVRTRIVFGAKRATRRSSGEKNEKRTALRSPNLRAADVDPASPAFLLTAEWRRLRYDVLKLRGSRCECCGASPKDSPGLRVNVDHVKPRRRYPELALEIANLQVLCGACNAGKGNRDETDWRGDASSADLEERLYMSMVANAPVCATCQARATTARWRLFNGGQIRLVWWCCGAQAGTGYLAPQWADRMHAGPRPGDAHDGAN